MSLESQKVSQDIKSKSQELWGNRRKFLSRGFVGSAIVFLGASGISRGSTEYLIENPDEIPDTIKAVPQTPRYLRKVPGAVEEHATKISKTRIHFDETGYKNGEEAHNWITIESPYGPEISDNMLFSNREDSLEAASRLRGSAVRNDSTTENANSEFQTRVGLGVAFIVVGTLTAYKRDDEGRINRRELLKRGKHGVITGSVFGLASKINSQA